MEPGASVALWSSVAASGCDVGWRRKLGKDGFLMVGQGKTDCVLFSSFIFILELSRLQSVRLTAGGALRTSKVLFAARIMLAEFAMQRVT